MASSSSSNVVHAQDHVFLRMPNGALKIVECKPGQIIELSKLGSIPVDSLLGRPYYHTYEVQEKAQDEKHPSLKIVSPDELNAEALHSDVSAEDLRDGEITDATALLEAAVMKNNRLTVDDGSRQALSQEEIEQLKRSSDGKAIIEKILANHSALDEKTDFARAKYTLRKAKKYLKRFALLPVELGFVIEFILEKEPARIMDMREESLALVASWSNAHWHADEEMYDTANGTTVGAGRLLVVDDTGGLVTAALAERKGILRIDRSKPAVTNGQHAQTASDPSTNDSFAHNDFPLPSQANSITVVHAAIQPNLSLLKYFGYDTNQADPDHPLHTHLKCLSWLQLLYPEEDPLHREPELVSEDTLQEWKSGKRGAYYKKRRRWARVKAIGDDTRSGSFDGLVVATHLDLVSVLSRAIPLLKGGAPVVVYSPTTEPLVKIMDLYSKERRTAFISHIQKNGEPPTSSEDFPLDPRLLLAPTLQTSRIRQYQVLPGRTHPLMTGRGGSEGYVFTAQRVIPVAGGVEARGNVSKKRKTVDLESSLVS